ncbi:MAG: hypothetical protein WCA63_09910 [Gallionella sp.]
MSEYFFPKMDMRQALLEALPANDQTSSEPARTPKFTYVPPSHARALDPENTIVEGMRGAGKSHWWAALNKEEHRKYLASVFPETRISGNIEISQGYGMGSSPNDWPGKDNMVSLIKSYEPRHIWQAVIAVHANFPAPFPRKLGKWSDMVKWVSEHAEAYDNLLYQVDQELARDQKVRLVLFDALDRLAKDWQGIRPLARALFQLALDLRSCRALRLKLFVRPDMLEDREILAFPDSSKLLGRKIALTWRRVDLYALLFHCLGNADAHGEMFRSGCQKLIDEKWQRNVASDTWLVPANLRADESLQRDVFHAISGPAMGKGPKRGFPYTWLPNHLIDGRDQVSPRSFVAALRHAVLEDDNILADWPYALYYRAIQAGVQKASQIRVDEITQEDYPWVESLMKPLNGNITVPCDPKDMIRLWQKNKTIDSLRDDQMTREVKLPPPHLEDREKGVLQDLEDLGVIQRMWDGRIQMPDVYRIAFGFGRRGGVKPLK